MIFNFIMYNIEMKYYLNRVDKMIVLVLSIIVAFLCGSIPTGYIIMKKFHGIDIRTMGSGNIGSTDV